MKILLVRADGVGDALVCAPLVAALRANGHGVGAVLGPRNRDVFAPKTFDAIHLLDRVPWPRHGATPASRIAALAGIRAARYDIALVATEEMDAYHLARDAHVPIRVGFTTGLAKPLKSLLVRALLTRTVRRTARARSMRCHEVEEIFRLGDGYVDSQGSASPTRDVRVLRNLIVGDESAANDTGVVVQASRKFEHIGLGAAAYIEIARYLRAAGHRVHVTGDDATLVRGIAAAGGANAAADVTTRAWITLLAGARAVVTGDSGAAHVAGMTGVPVVDFFPPTSATLADIRRWRPWASRCRTIVVDPTRAPHELAAIARSAVADIL